MNQDTDMYGHYAGFVSRLFAFVLDVLILVVAVTLITWLITVVNGLVRVDAILGGLLGAGAVDVASVILAMLLTFGVYIGYPLFFWTLTGQTLGMTLMGLRVVTTDGHYLSLGRSVRRLIGYLVSALVLWLGFLWILVDDRRQGWHDKIAGTCVVYTWHARPDEAFFRKLLDS
jgi:uncharacterized RDD family membrane protein YckC